MPPYRTAGDDEPIVSLGCGVWWGPPGKRPRIETQPADHPLYPDQRDGITIARSAEMVEAVMHPRRH